MLWRRHHAQTQAAREAKGRQEEDAELWQGRYPARGLHRSAQNGRELGGKLAAPATVRPRAKRMPKDPKTLSLRSPCFDAGRNQGVTMRVAPYLLSAILLSTMLGAAQAEPGGLEGSWSGSGTAKLRNRVDRIVCRVSFGTIAQKSFRVSSFCSMGDRRYERSGRRACVAVSRYTSRAVHGHCDAGRIV